MTNGANAKKLNIMLLSLHGLIRGENPELGQDADTGGQVLYVLDLARSLAKNEQVNTVRLITRRIQDVRVVSDYAEFEEDLGSGAKIVRIDCGPRRYLRKERLWPYLDELADRIVYYISKSGVIPDVIHGHYADAGYVGAQVSRLLGVPFIFTGHSLGRVKRQRLLAKGKDPDTIESQYNLNRRIEGEEIALETASLVVTSTGQEIEEQYKLYDHYEPQYKRVIPPGIDLSRFHPPRRHHEHPAIEEELDRFLTDPKKPMVLAISRADERKNIATLVEAYAKTPGLKEKANLVILAGNRDDIPEMDRGSRRVLRQLLLDIDKYDLYGRVAYPKHHHPEDVPALYRLAAKTRGLFVNPALTEPFGLTLLEAAATGLPVIATNDGGPMDIIGNCGNGELVDPLDATRMGEVILSGLSDRSRWKAWSRSGLRGAHRLYTWDGHVRTYLKEVTRVTKGFKTRFGGKGAKNPLPTVERLLICDIDNTLLGDEKALSRLMRLIGSLQGRVGFGIATGRHLASAKEILKKWGVRTPDLWITDVGSQIQYGNPVAVDVGWEHHLEDRWQPEKIREALAQLPGLSMQPTENQHKYKISYNLDEENPLSKREIEKHLRKQGLRANVVHSHDAYLDILPIRASKGLAVRYLALKWGIPFERILVAGDSGNDADMLGGDMLGVVVGNYSPELKSLKNKPRVVFVEGEYAQGVIDGIKHYDFFGKISIPGETNDSNE